MNILIVSAHPEPTSLTNALRREAVEQLRADGHDVRLSDLYAAKWKAVIDREDFPNLPPAKRLQVAAASAEAFAAAAPELTGFVAHVRRRRSAIGQPTPSQHINQQDEKI